jgi:hypothetical protein
MRHVDEGTIHAWLDEQITEPAEAAWLEQHLGECDACRERLAGERATFDRAQTLLADTRAVAEGPSFEALVARAGRNLPQSDTAATGRFTRGRREQLWMRAGWAASLALAVGVGWAARELTERDTVRPELQPAIAERAVARNDAPSQGAAVPEQAVTVAPTPTAADASTRPQRASGQTANATARRSEPPPPAAPAIPAPESPLPASPVETITEQAAPAAVIALRQETSRTTGDPTTTPAAAPADAPWRPLPRTEAAARTGMPLYGIDGLEPQFTALSADGALVRTLYRLASGDLVELVQQRITPNSSPSVDLQATARAFTGIGRAGVVADRAAAVPRTWSDVRGGVRITLQTASGAADLDALGTRLRID